MRNRNLQQQLQRLERLFQETRTASRDNLEIQAHWAKYLCVLTAGFLENAISEIYIEFVRNASSMPVANYASSMLEKIQNPQTQKFLDIARAFKGEWATELEMFVNQDGRREAINSIMSNRHLIAHGQHSTVTISKLKEWLEKSIQVIELIDEQCNR